MRTTRRVVCVILCTSVAVMPWSLSRRTEGAVAIIRLGTGLPPTGSAGVLPQTWVAPTDEAPRIDGKIDEDTDFRYEAELKLDRKELAVTIARIVVDSGS